MRLLYDDQIFCMQKYGGISRVFVELFRVLEYEDSIEWDVQVEFPHNAYIREFEETYRKITAYSQFLGGADFRGKGRLYTATRKILPTIKPQQDILTALRNGKTDLFHPTYYDDYFLEKIENVPFVITVHDMIHELFSEYFTDNSVVLRKARLVEAAQRVIAISESTKADLVRITGVDAGKVEVVPLASSIEFVKTENRSLTKPTKYLLYIGHRDGYKNFSRFFRAIAPLMRADKELSLVCIGGKITGGQFPAVERRVFHGASLEDQVFVKSVDDAFLGEWYADALCFVFPSLYEGFGLPLLEAFSCGCPVAASNTSSFLEVGGDAAAYFDPHSEEDIRETIAELVRSRQQRENLVQRGREQAKRFSWINTARKTIQVYDRVLTG